MCSGRGATPGTRESFVFAFEPSFTVWHTTASSDRWREHTIATAAEAPRINEEEAGEQTQQAELEQDGAGQMETAYADAATTYPDVMLRIMELNDIT